MRRTYSASGVEQAAQSVSRAGQNRSGPASEQFFSALSRSRNLPICKLLAAFRLHKIIRKSLTPRCEQFSAVNFNKRKKRDPAASNPIRIASVRLGENPVGSKRPHRQVGSAGVPGGIRTHDLPLRRRTLYPAELRKHNCLIMSYILCTKECFVKH